MSTAPLLRLAALRDLSTFRPNGEFDLTNRVITGPRVVLEWVVRCWFSPQGSIVWARDRGFDVLALENSSLDLETLFAIKARLIEEARKVMYVSSVALELILNRNVLAIDAAITLVDGKRYPLAVTIENAGRALFSFGGLS